MFLNAQNVAFYNFGQLYLILKVKLFAVSQKLYYAHHRIIPANQEGFGTRSKERLPVIHTW